MSNQTLPQTLPKQAIILDTCILQYTSDRHFGSALIKYLGELMGRGFDLAISQISVLELLAGSSVKNESDGLFILNLFKNYLVDVNTLIAASQISTLYQQEKLPLNQISMADKIIGATSILTGSPIFTADVNDFPRPFFNEVEEHLFYFEKNHKNNMRVTKLLRPNLLVVNERFGERE